MTKKTIPSWNKAYLGAILTFIVLLALGTGYVRALSKNTHLDHLRILEGHLAHQASRISHALRQAETPLTALAAMVKNHTGQIKDFAAYAANLLNENSIISALNLAPEGIVSSIYPLAGNEAAIGHDLLSDPERRTEVAEAIATRSSILAGPVNMRQGGNGFFLRKPVFLEQNGENKFWGLVVAKIMTTDLFANVPFDDLEAQGYNYCLSRHLDTDQEPVIIASSAQDIVHSFAVHQNIPVSGGYWRLDLSFDSSHTHSQLPQIMALALAVLGTALVFLTLRNKERLQRQANDLSQTNALLKEEISRRVATEASLRQAKETAEAAVQAKADFLAFMTHEIRTPISGLFGILQLLDMTALDHEQKDFVDTGVIAVKSLINLINDLLDFSKMEAGKMETEETDFAINELFRSIPNLFRAQTESKNITLHLNIDEDVPEMLHGDPDRIRQIVLNLISNAVKFTDQGDVTLQLSILKNEQKNHILPVRLRVQDTGIGIPADQLDILFQPYAQSRGTGKRLLAGTGLGLSIVKQLVDLMGGSVSLESAVGMGTTVAVTLPLHKAQTQHPEAKVNQDSPAPRKESGLTILVAEDDPIAQTMLASILRKLGHSPLCVDNGKEAIKKWQEADVDLIFMDIMMPGMDGWEATRRIREEEQRKGSQSRVPIVAVTALLTDSNQAEFLAAGLDDAMPKPVHLDDLKNVCNRFG